MKSIQQSLRHPDALVPNLLVLAYILLGYPGGWLLMARPGWLLPAVGVLRLVAAWFLVSDSEDILVVGALAYCSQGQRGKMTRVVRVHTWSECLESGISRI